MRKSTLKRSTKKSSKKTIKPGGLKIGEERIYPGERRRFSIKFAAMYDFTQLTIPVEVIRGKKPGPTMFISAAIHGDELNGVEIIKRILARPDLKRLSGTLIVIPVVNVFGFNLKSRYLPDRRDLNRSFPGSPNGSIAARLANLFMKEIVKKCQYGIDLHTGALHRDNLPQIRACLDDKETEELAESFGVPVVIHSRLRDGSLREAALKRKVKMLLFEGGEALRFQENVIQAGVKGCVSVMRKIGMLPPKKSKSSSASTSSVVMPQPKSMRKSFLAKGSSWVRAPRSGSFQALKRLGAHVQEGDVLATISDTFGGQLIEVKAPEDGVIIGMTQIPLLNQGGAMFHIATFKNTRRVARAIVELDEAVIEGG